MPRPPRQTPRASRTVQLDDDQYSRLREIAQELGYVTAREDRIIGSINRLLIAIAEGRARVEKVEPLPAAGEDDAT